jgi:hypothetical protein
MSSNRLAAIGLQLLSLAATGNFFNFFVKAGSDPRQWAIVAAFALLFEMFFVFVKESAFKPGIPPKAIAFIFGYLPDGLINAGGIMFFAAAVLTFGPIAAMLGVVEVDLANPDELLLIVIGISLFFGFGLSIAPHILWRNWGKQAPARA